MAEDINNLSIKNIKEGAAIEMFDLALQRALENINDVNTTLDKREVVFKLTLKPSKCRTVIEINFGATAKLAAQESMYVAADLRLDQKGRAVAFERNRQRPIPFDNVQPMKGE